MRPNSKSDFKRDFESALALRAVSTVNELLLNRAEILTVSTKTSPRDIVTELDVAIEKHLSEVLKDSHYRIVGEESYDEKNAPLSPGPCWLLDPIDGTVNFVNGMPLYAISVGLYDRGFVTGAISLPVFKELFFTYQEHSYLNGTRLHVNDCALTEAVVVECFSEISNNQERENEYELFSNINEKSRGCLRLGSAATSLCYAACGRIQGVVGFENQVWDIAAGIAIAKQAGCEVVLSLDPSSTRVSYIVGTKSVVLEIQRLCKEHHLSLGG